MTGTPLSGGSARRPCFIRTALGVSPFCLLSTATLQACLITVCRANHCLFVMLDLLRRASLGCSSVEFPFRVCIIHSRQELRWPCSLLKRRQSYRNVLVKTERTHI
ncbi:hypothetical protein NEOLEDRAFT_361933 [Neolentinus lepideus HHB14362 ss-1]|uniref:Uncharacterized protein n=1 Tax=Neolentinus lepideus HHB14362 ss-1 TaxID=1314782 RepID=A0A165SNF5_9AGAM|nr:hypothetical protein NEOLEDRAFT_361933 [Neolentinus lepideus HHB14362 ss-1]